MELVDKYTDVFSSTTGLTHLVHQKIKTPPGVEPYRVPKAFHQVIEEEGGQMLQDSISKEICAKAHCEPLSMQ